jgi:hypothetical protein
MYCNELTDFGETFYWRSRYIFIQASQDLKIELSAQKRTLVYNGAS